MKKIIKISVLCMLAMSVLTTICFAGRIDYAAGASSVPTKLEESAVRILGVVQWLGIGLAVAMSMFVGVKYLTSTATKKAEMKQVMLPVLIGIVILAISSTIVTWILNAFYVPPTAP